MQSSERDLTDVALLESRTEVPAGTLSPVDLMRVEAQPAPTRAPEPRRRGRPRSLVWVGTGAQILCLSLLAYTFLFNLSVVRGSSMAPRIHDGDRILIDHISYLFGDVGRGDIVVLKYPLDPSVDYIKRVIGLPGDEILMEDGNVWVNGQKLDEPYVASPDSRCRVFTQVKPAHFFVLGDNRQRSSDSREFGQVPQDYVRGKVEIRIWPPLRIGSID
jgi:signal peptidase I